MVAREHSVTALTIPHFRGEYRQDSHHCGEEKMNSLVLSPTGLVLAINLIADGRPSSERIGAPAPSYWRGAPFGLEVYIRPSNHRAGYTTVMINRRTLVSTLEAFLLPVGVFPSSCLFRA